MLYLNNRRQQSVLLGNGFNRLTKGNPSWEELLEEIAKGKIDKNIPNTLRYEAVILKQPYREEPNRVFTSDGYALKDADRKAIYASGEVGIKIEERYSSKSRSI